MKLPLKRFAFEVYDANDNIIADCGVGDFDKDTMIEHADTIVEAINTSLDVESKCQSATEALKEVVQACKDFFDARKVYDAADIHNDSNEWEALEAAEKRLDDLLTLHYHIITTGEAFKPKGGSHD